MQDLSFICTLPSPLTCSKPAVQPTNQIKLHLKISRRKPNYGPSFRGSERSTFKRHSYDTICACQSSTSLMFPIKREKSSGTSWAIWKLLERMCQFELSRAENYNNIQNGQKGAGEPSRYITAPSLPTATSWGGSQIRTMGYANRTCTRKDAQLRAHTREHFAHVNYKIFVGNKKTPFWTFFWVISSDSQEYPSSTSFSAER